MTARDARAEEAAPTPIASALRFYAAAVDRCVGELQEWRRVSRTEERQE